MTKQDLQEADILIIASDVKLARSERFEGIKKVEIPVSAAIKNAGSLIRKIEEKLKEK
ncbi:MAG: hypothetical protein U5K84_13430 [Alkalibacterium sp.]|nr:hypothetical protein [Alkalibacterium sp.]